MKIVIDSSIYIDHLRSVKGKYREIISLGKNENISFYTPTMVIVELWTGLSSRDISILNTIKRLIKPTKIIDLNRQIAERAGILIRENQIGDTEDAIIAATALELDAQLATMNVKHFKNVKGLQFFNK